MPKVLIDGNLVDVPASALFADDGQSPLVADPATPPTPPTPVFTAEDVERARQEGAAEVQGRLDEVNTRLAELTETVGSLTASEQREQARLEEERQRLEAERRQQEEEQLDPVELIRRKEEEWRNQLSSVESKFTGELEAEREARQAAEALAAKEREFNNLRDYIADQIQANQDKIAPQLLEWVNGNSKEEVDQSIARAIQTTDAIAAEMQEAFGGQVPHPQQIQIQQPVQPTPGVRAVGGPANVDPAGLGQQTLTPEQINNMPMNKYAELRKSLGIGGQSSDRGLFG